MKNLWRKGDDDPAMEEIQILIGGTVSGDLEAGEAEMNPPSDRVQKDWPRVEKLLAAAGYFADVKEWQDIHAGPADPKTGEVKVVGRVPKHVVLNW